MARRALPYRSVRPTSLPASTRVLGTSGNILDPGRIVGPIVTGRGAGKNPADFGNLPAPVRAAIGGPLGLLIGADLDFGDIALRIGAAVIGVAFVIAGGFLIVKETQASAVGKAVGQGIGAISGKA